jgi:hypothetical protein
MSYNNLMNVTAKIERNTPTQDSFGSSIDAWSTITAAEPCRLKRNANANANARQREAIGEYLEKSFTVYMKPTANVLCHDRLTIGGLVYDVMANNKDSANHHFELDCELIED